MKSAILASACSDEAREADLGSVLDAAMREDFLSFLRKVFGELDPATTFLCGWHLEAIAYQLQRVSDGDVRRLITTMPPRYLKSITISIAWVAWWLGKAPEMRFICVSYSAELAVKLSRDCRKVMESGWYRKLFPGTILCRATDLELETMQGGGRLATSVFGSVTGRGAECIIIDDPIKAEEAMLEGKRRKVIKWVTSTLFSRLNDKKTGAMILVMQRLHEDDLAGHLLACGGWDHLNLPAICEERQVVPLLGGRSHERLPGDVLHPARESREDLEQIRREVGTYVFSAQCQQAPVPGAGTLVKRDWLRRYDVAPDRRPGDEVIQSWDTASKDGVLNDYSVCITALVRKHEVYILNVFRRQLAFPDLLKQVEMQAEPFDPDLLLIEDAASGQQLIQVLHDEPRPNVPPPIACKPQADKMTRLSAVCALIEAGRLVLPKDAPWLADFERELLGFPFAKHDDQVDALSQLLTSVRQRPKIINAMAWISAEEDEEDF